MADKMHHSLRTADGGAAMGADKMHQPLRTADGGAVMGPRPLFIKRDREMVFALLANYTGDPPGSPVYFDRRACKLHRRPARVTSVL